MSNLTTIKEKLKALESELKNETFIVLNEFERDGRSLHLALTERLRKKAKKEGIWNSKEMAVTLKNGAYGFDEEQARSLSGRDGIFLLDRSFKPPNVMMKKLFDQYLDKPESGADELARSLDMPLEDLLPVRLVSHHLRLLGVLARKPDADWLILVDCDRS